jgi:hypothetical protein
MFQHRRHVLLNSVTVRVDGRDEPVEGTRSDHGRDRALDRCSLAHDWFDTTLS